MLCSNCSKQTTVSDAEFCPNCGTALDAPTPVAEHTTLVSDRRPDGFLANLVRGDYGLAKTYWLFGVLVNVVAQFLLILTRGLSLNNGWSPGFYVLLFLIYAVFEILVIIGIWRSATAYSGPKIWAILAKIACVIGLVFLAISVLSIMAALRAFQ